MASSLRPEMTHLETADESESARSVIHIERLDHLVLTVQDIQKSIDFYTGVLGMTEVTFKGGRKALRFGRQKLNLHEAAGPEVLPRAARPTPGSADLCLVTRNTEQQILQHLQRCAVRVEQGPVERTGALGPIRSVYIRDPDNNLVELAVYSDEPAS